MKNLKPVLLLPLFILLSTSAFAQYCSISYTQECALTNHYISLVETKGGTSNFSNPTSCNGNYHDFTPNTNLVVSQHAGGSVDVKVAIPNNTYVTLVRIYIDWNQDGDFTDANELVTSGTTTQYVLGHSALNGTYKVNVPRNASHGKTRMRVRIGSQGPIYDPNLGPCNTSNYGETEDYTFEVDNTCYAPQSLSTQNNTPTKTTIEWVGKPNVSYYEYHVQRNNSTPPAAIGNNLTADTSIAPDTLKCNTLYYVFVRAICDTSGPKSGWTKTTWATTSFTTMQCCQAPQIVITSVGATHANANWSAVASATAYNYSISSSATPPGTSTTSPNNFIKQLGLQPNSKYYVHARSVCATTTSEWSIDSFTTFPLSVTDVERGKAHAYPNPVSDVIHLTGIEVNTKVSILNISGQLVKQVKATSNKLSVAVSELPTGSYSILLTAPNGEATVLMFEKR